MELLMRETHKDENNSRGNLPEEAVTEAPLLADQPALDLLNTVLRTDAGIVDTLQGDDDVLRWLARAGFLDAKAAPQLRRGSLLSAARTLRETLRPLVVARKSGRRLDPAPLNHFLSKGTSHQELVRSGSALTSTRRYDLTTPEGVLAPLAEAAADLLANADFSLVRRCEGAGCVLWFYDRTKAHRRRWCSMQACGNRNKVAEFRARHRA
jgi:predicted RNA-binding Zn ribbon-like protein